MGQSSKRETVVQFGAGNIGRGFTGQLFTDAGYEVVFVDVVPEVVAALNERREYPLRFVGPTQFETRTIGPVRCVDGRDREAVSAEVAQCAFACTAVGVGALPHLLPALAAGVRARTAPLDVILCENQLHVAQLVRGLLEKELTPEQSARLGLVESVVSRMVPVVPEEVRRGDPLLVIAEDYRRLPVDRNGFLGPIPEVPGLEAVEHYSAEFEKKLYLHNMGHAVAAYLGYRAGCATVDQAMQDAAVQSVVREAFDEVTRALIRKGGHQREALERYCADLLRRFSNAAMGDTVLRVGRDPLRKLRAEDRLVGAARVCQDWDVEPRAIAQGIAAALLFDPADDPGAMLLQRMRRDESLGEVLQQVTGQRPDGELGRWVLEAYDELERSE